MSWRELVYELEGAALGLSLAVLTALALVRRLAKIPCSRFQRKEPKRWTH